MTFEQFTIAYQNALATQDWTSVEPLITKEACVTFSNGSVYKGIDNIQAAYENNFRLINSEKYEMKNISWLKKETDYAVYVFEYHWSGIMNDKLISGQGVGTSVIIKVGEDWKLLSEHLGKT